MKANKGKSAKRVKTLARRKPAVAFRATNVRSPRSRPFLDARNIDYLARINMELIAELWVTRDRIAVLEALLETRSVLKRGEIDTFVPDQRFTEKNEKLRSVFVENILGAPFKHEHSVATLKAMGARHAALWRDR